MIYPSFITGNSYSDTRGIVRYNNNFDASEIKRYYTIENLDCNIIRGWQGHQTEQRWFTAIVGSFIIDTLSIEAYNSGNVELVNRFTVESESLDILHIPAGFLTSIRSLIPHSKLLVMSDYRYGEIQDEVRFPIVNS